MDRPRIDKTTVGRPVGGQSTPKKYSFTFNTLGVKLAERVGFEPTIGYKPMLVFKTSAFNRSATSPNCHRIYAIPSYLFACQRVH